MPLLKVGGRRFLLTASDLVLPLCCGIVLHLFFLVCVVLTALYLPHANCEDENDLSRILRLQYFLYCAIACHACIVCVNCMAISIGLSLKVMNSSTVLSYIIHFRVFLNLVDLCLAIWGLYLILIHSLSCLDTTTRVLLIVSVTINWVNLLIGCCSMCCLSVSEQTQRQKAANMQSTDLNQPESLHGIRASSMGNLHDNEAATNKLQSSIRTVCCAWMWEGRAWNHGEVNEAFAEMGTLMQILMHIQEDHMQDLAPTDILTGLQLYRMLQKHYQLHDLGFYHPYKADGYRHTFLNADKTEIITKKKGVALEIGTKTNASSKKQTSSTDFVALPDASVIKDNAQQTSAAVVAVEDGEEEEEHSKSRTPSSQYGTFADGESVESAKKNKQRPLISNINLDFTAEQQAAAPASINNVQSYLHHGMQPKLSKEELFHVEEGIYYTKYAIGSYGCPLYSLEYPCGICCVPPCCLPTGLSRDRIYGTACCGLASIKVFLRRSGITGADLLVASQFSGLHQLTYFVAVDRSKKKLVIAIRGSESLPDGVTDVNCKPTVCDSIDPECYCHDGFRLSMLNLFEAIEKNEATQRFLRENTDFGIIAVGHSLGAGVAVLLTLQLLRNKEANPNYANREIHCYGIAPPPTISQVYAEKVTQEMEKHISVFIYNKDMVPRLQWHSVLKTKCAIIRLLAECDQSSWWIFREGLAVNHKSIVDALHKSCEYILHDEVDKIGATTQGANNRKVRKITAPDMAIEEEETLETDVAMSLKSEEKDGNNDETEEKRENQTPEREKKHLRYLNRLKTAHMKWIRDIRNDVKELSHMAVKENIGFGPSLWNIRLTQVGMIFHIINANEMNIKMMHDTRNKECVCCTFCCTAMLNCCRCKCCHPGSVNPLKEDNYIIYRADASAFNEIIISSRMGSDHMPQVYKNVLNAVDTSRLHQMTYDSSKQNEICPDNRSDLYPGCRTPIAPLKQKSKSLLQ